MPNFGPINGAPINGGAAAGTPRRVRAATVERAPQTVDAGRATVQRADGRPDPRNAEAR